MQPHIIINASFLLVFTHTADALTSALNNHDGYIRNISTVSNSSISGFLLPGYYRNTTPGAAWVMPASPFDLGARDMTCECFDPDGT